jgi:hypothetical protein
LRNRPQVPHPPRIFRSHPECVPSPGGLLAQLRLSQHVSRTNEIARNAFVSVRKRAVFRIGAIDFAGSATSWLRASARHGRKDSRRHEKSAAANNASLFQAIGAPAECPPLRVQRTSAKRIAMSANDPKRSRRLSRSCPLLGPSCRADAVKADIAPKRDIRLVISGAFRHARCLAGSSSRSISKR